MIGNIHNFAITKAFDYAAKLKFVMATHYLCKKFLVFHSPGILFVISLNAWPVYISNGLDTDLYFSFTVSKTCPLRGKMSRIFSLPGRVSINVSNKRVSTLQIFTPWKLRGLGITGSLQGKPALSMEKGCKNHKETLCMLWINPVIFTDCEDTPW